MTAQEIRTLPIDEKVRIMAAIWEDMRDHYEEVPISQEVIDLLKERQARVNRGEAHLLDWDKVKFAIGRG
ncbi:MAG: addiction module protein [Candidatus Methylacidiphilales bacterium]